MDNKKKIAIKFLLSNSMTGLLIGVGGKSIQELIAITDARILVSGNNENYPGSNDRVILVSGNKENVSSASTLIWEMIALITKNNGNDSRNLVWNPRAVNEELGQNDSVEVSARFTIPAASGGAILGKNGATIQSIAAESGAKLSLTSKEEALFTHERIVSIVGTTAQCVLCAELILERLASQEEIFPFVNRGTTYSSPLNASLGLIGVGFDGNHKHGGGGSAGGRRAGGGSNSSSSAAGRGRGRRVQEGDAKDVETKEAIVADATITLSVPDELVGNIFGKNGTTMREIISLSGAKVTVSRRGEFVEGTTNRLVTITGSPTAAQTAHLFITQRLHTPSNPTPRRPKN